MAAIETAITTIMQIIFSTSFAGQFWISQLAVLIASMALITRKPQDWMTLLLPVMVGWEYFGISFSWIFYTVAAAMFVIDTLSIQTVSAAIGSVSETFGTAKLKRQAGGVLAVNKKLKKAKRINIQEQMAILSKKADDWDNYQTTDYKLARKKEANAEHTKNKLLAGEAMSLLGGTKQRALKVLEGQNGYSDEALAMNYARQERVNAGMPSERRGTIKQKMLSGINDNSKLTANEARAWIRITKKKRHMKDKSRDVY